MRLLPARVKSRSALVETLEHRVLASASAPVTHTAAATGLSAVYYDNPDFTGASVARVDQTVNFHWGASAPAAGIAAHSFSARWTGNVIPSVTQPYTFTVAASDGVRLWINNQILINDWNAHSTPHTDAGTIALSAGQAATLRLEYFDGADPAAITLYWSGKATARAIVPASRLQPATDPLLAKIDNALGFARQQLSATLAQMNGNTATYPDYTAANGTWITSNVYNWTAGFFPGQLWQMYSRTNDPALKAQATTWTLPLAVNAQYFTDDLTFRVFNAYYPLYRATGNPAYKQVILQACAQRVSTFNAAVGAFSSVGVASHSGNPLANLGVLMDHMMDLSMVFWGAAQTGNKTWYNDALSTARTVARDFFRADGSVYQWGYFNKTSGQFIDGENYQGYTDSSAWARAQAWAIHAFTDVYRATGAVDMLADARRVANFYESHLPSDGVPYWDFNAPGIPATYRDSSAAAIAAAGLFELGRVDPNHAEGAAYFADASATLNSLLSPAYLAQGTSSLGILQHGAWFVPAPIKNGDASLAWGDYYLLQAVNEYLAMPGALPGT